ncbi:hypothetical protein AJ80_04125 [Polytolypa hystricis UAMH7299]|uniref:Uncharacterized protein n=1 Tax=Polytolypa hystricis (strain UAMH7299) TaxID=1447883 RepID=A0A2B7YDJ0_POLH7|nr:hypothetical protein AJ80_04125 [Polytolypa hystricis UAMH7299]
MQYFEVELGLAYHLTLSRLPPNLTSRLTRSPSHLSTRHQHRGAMRPPIASPTQCLLQCRVNRPTRPYFTTILTRRFLSISPVSRHASLADFRDYNVTVPVGSSGEITLNVLQPFTADTPSKARNNVILYLPPGPLFRTTNTPPPAVAGPARSNQSTLSPQHILATATSATIVTINYRLGDIHSPNNEQQQQPKKTCFQYPAPVHDTLAGFDWVLKNANPHRICVFGSRIGGSLAVMLALTEPRSIAAIAAMEPTVDWVGLDDYCRTEAVVVEEDDVDDDDDDDDDDGSEAADGTAVAENTAQNHRRGRKRKIAPPDLVPLLEARRKFFPNPNSYFDSFASPVLFLRSPGKECPPVFPAYLTGPEYPVPVLTQSPPLETQTDIPARLIQELDIDFDPDEEIEPEPRGVGDNSVIHARPIRRRRALSRWPPYGLDYASADGLWGGSRSGVRREEIELPQVRILVQNNNHTPTTAAAGCSADAFLAFSVVEKLNLHSDEKHDNNNNDAHPATQDKINHTTSSYILPHRRGKLGEAIKASGDTVLAHQAAEMVYLMQNACFWGREKGYAEDRVRLVRVPGGYPVDGSAVAVVAEDSANGEEVRGVDDLVVGDEAGKWFREVLS